jgi:pyruvate,orthophosphate dikinase
MVKALKKCNILLSCIIAAALCAGVPSGFTLEESAYALSPQSRIQYFKEKAEDGEIAGDPEAAYEEFVARIMTMRDCWIDGSPEFIKHVDDLVVKGLGSRAGNMRVDEYSIRPLALDGSGAAMQVVFIGKTGKEFPKTVVLFRPGVTPEEADGYRDLIPGKDMAAALADGFYICSDKDYYRFILSRHGDFFAREKAFAEKALRQILIEETFQKYLDGFGGPEGAPLEQVYQGIVGNRRKDLYVRLHEYLAGQALEGYGARSASAREYLYRLVKDMKGINGGEAKQAYERGVKSLSRMTVENFKEIRSTLRLINELPYQEALPLIDNLIINTKMRKITADTAVGETMAHVARDIRDELKKLLRTRIDKHNYFVFYILARYLPKVSLVQNELDEAWSVVQYIDENLMNNAMSNEIREKVHGHVDKETARVVDAYVTYLETGDTKQLSEAFLAQKLDDDDRAQRANYETYGPFYPLYKELERRQQAGEKLTPASEAKLKQYEGVFEVYDNYVRVRDALRRVFDREVSDIAAIKEQYRGTLDNYPDVKNRLEEIEKDLGQKDNYNAVLKLSLLKFALRNIIFDKEVDPDVRMDCVYLEEDCTYIEYLQLAEYLKDTREAKARPIETLYENFDLIYNLVEELGDFGLISRETQELCGLLAPENNRYLSLEQIRDIIRVIFEEYNMIRSSITSEFRESVLDIFKNDQLKTYQFLNAIVRRGYLLLPKFMEITEQTKGLVSSIPKEKWRYKTVKMLPQACDRIPGIGELALQDAAVVRRIAGCKGANLVHMVRLGFPVPPACIISNEFSPKDFSTDNFREKVRAAVSNLEKEVRKQTGKELRFGDPDRPLLVSVRAAGIFTMPGILQTTVNVGINDGIAARLAQQTGNPWFVYDTYRRFIKNYATNVFGLPEELFMPVIENVKKTQKVPLKEELSGEHMKEVVEIYKDIVRREGYGPRLEEALEDPFRALMDVIRAAKDDWESRETRAYTDKMNIARDWHVALIVQQMVFGNKINVSEDRTQDSLTVVCHSREYNTFRISPKGEIKFNAQGDDIVSGETGMRGIKPLAYLKMSPYAAIYRKIVHILNKADTYFRAPQEAELTVENGELSILQTRSYSFKKQASRRLAASEKPAARGFGVGGGGFRGVVAFVNSDFEKLRDLAKEKGLDGVLLVIDTPFPKYTSLALEADALLAHRGGSTSHLAISCQEREIPGIFGVDNLHVRPGYAYIDLEGGAAHTFREGDVISIDAGIGEGLVYLGEQKIAEKGEPEQVLPVMFSKDNVAAADRILKEKKAVGVLFGEIFTVIWRIDAKEADLETLKNVDVLVVNPGVELGELNKNININWSVPEVAAGVLRGWVDRAGNMISLGKSSKLLEHFADKPPGLYLMSPKLAAEVIKGAEVETADKEKEAALLNFKQKILDALSRASLPKIGRELFGGKVLPYPKDVALPVTPEGLSREEAWRKIGAVLERLKTLAQEAAGVVGDIQDIRKQEPLDRDKLIAALQEVVITGNRLYDCLSEMVKIPGTAGDKRDAADIYAFKREVAHDLSNTLAYFGPPAQLVLLSLKGGGDLSWSGPSFQQITAAAAKLPVDIENFRELAEGADAWTVIDARKLLREVYGEFLPVARGKGLEMRLEDAGEDFYVAGRAPMLKMSLNKLVENAIKYTEKGSITIRLDKRIVKNVESVLVEVEDTGIGVADADRKNIFSGVRGETALRAGIPGTGWGLRSVKKVIAIHGGGVEVGSVEGKGSVFAVSLPAAEFTLSPVEARRLFLKSRLFSGVLREGLTHYFLTAGAAAGFIDLPPSIRERLKPASISQLDDLRNQLNSFFKKAPDIGSSAGLYLDVIRTERLVSDLGLDQTSQAFFVKQMVDNDIEDLRGIIRAEIIGYAALKKLLCDGAVAMKDEQRRDRCVAWLGDAVQRSAALYDLWAAPSPADIEAILARKGVLSPQADYPLGPRARGAVTSSVAARRIFLKTQTALWISDALLRFSEGMSAALRERQPADTASRDAVEAFRRRVVDERSRISARGEKLFGRFEFVRSDAGNVEQAPERYGDDLVGSLGLGDAARYETLSAFAAETEEAVGRMRDEMAALTEMIALIREGKVPPARAEDGARFAAKLKAAADSARATVDFWARQAPEEVEIFLTGKNILPPQKETAEELRAIMNVLDDFRPAQPRDIAPMSETESAA